MAGGRGRDGTLWDRPLGGNLGGAAVEVEGEEGACGVSAAVWVGGISDKTPSSSSSEDAALPAAPPRRLRRCVRMRFRLLALDNSLVRL